VPESNVTKSTETEIAIAILKIALTRDNRLVTLKRAYREIPDYVKLSIHDLSQSLTRPNEPMWHQIVRNIKSHSDMEGNFINEGFLEHVPSVGYRMTAAGEQYTKSLS
jgi:hypothetical protein